MLILRIKSVDMNGWLGREYHPEPSDEGLIVGVMGVLVVFYQGGDNLEEYVIDPDGDTFVTDTHLEMKHATRPIAKRVFNQTMSGQMDSNYPEATFSTMFRCVTMDHRQLDLMEHEVEVVSLNGRSW